MSSISDPIKSSYTRSLEAAQYETEHLPLENPLVSIAKNLPELLPFPFSGVIAIQRGDSPIIQACHCPEQAAFTPDQPFNVLSVGKIFTTVAVMQLIEEGKFSLTTPLSQLLSKEELDVPLKAPYLGAKPDRSALENLSQHTDRITIEHLLTHTGGFVERGEVESWDKNNIGYHSYSNYGFQLLARIIGKYSGEGSFQGHIEKRIFKPAGMKGAIREFHFPTRIKPDCFEISKSKERVRVKETEKEPYPHGNGCWRMPASDLLAFSRALHQHHVLISEDSFKSMKEHRAGSLGLQVDRHPKDGSIIGYGHPGSGTGISSFLHHWNTSPPITIAVVSNYSGCTQVQPILRSILERYFDKLRKK